MHPDKIELADGWLTLDDLSPEEGQALLDKGDAWEKLLAASSETTALGHRWEGLIRQIGLGNFKELAFLPAAKRLERLAELKRYYRPHNEPEAFDPAQADYVPVP